MTEDGAPADCELLSTPGRMPEEFEHCENLALRGQPGASTDDAHPAEPGSALGAPRGRRRPSLGPALRTLNADPEPEADAGPAGCPPDFAAGACASSRRAAETGRPPPRRQRPLAPGLAP